MSSENTPTTHTNDIERCQQRWRYYTLFKIQ